jgi:hypothetical protein
MVNTTILLARRSETMGSSPLQVVDGAEEEAAHLVVAAASL